MNRLRRWFPWILAFLVAAGAGYYQRRTGPTWPMRSSIDVDGEAVRYRLLRSGTTGENLKVAVPAARAGGVVEFRRFPTRDDWTTVALIPKDDGLMATLPSQPPAGKLEYRVRLSGEDGELTLPPGGPVVARFKGAVPPWVLIPHIAVIFGALVFGFRAAFGAVFASPNLFRQTLWATVAMTIGGMILGPCVQKYAFGEFWTGWPNGKDLTDNKMLLLWVAWLIALAAVRFLRSARLGRVTVVAAAVVMVGVYLIPHSLRGSELNYDKLDRGVSAEEAVETG